MAYANIQNGTQSRIRTVKQTPTAWTCPVCRRDNARWSGNCPDCYTPRP